MFALSVSSLRPPDVVRSLREAVTTGRVVALGFATLVVATGIYLFRFGINLPIQDEWDLTVQLLRFGYGLEWICLPHNEHRFVLGRAIWGLGLTLSGYDFRVGGWVTFTVLVLSAAWLLRTAVKIRGHASLADLFVPAVLVNAGHCFNLAMGYQIVFAATTLCAVGMIATALQARLGNEFRTGWQALLWLILMAGNGGFGIGFAPAIALWITYLAWRCWRQSRGKALVLMTGTAVVLSYVVWSMLTIPSNPNATYRPTPGAFVTVASAYCGIGLGACLSSGGMTHSIWLPILVAVVVIVELLAVLRLMSVIGHRPGERPLAFGLLAVLGGHFAVAIGIALTRDGALADRYVTPATVGLLAAWATGICYGPRTAIARLGSVILVVMAAVGVAVANSSPTRHDIQHYLIRSSLYQLQQDLRGGMPSTFLEGKYAYTYGVLMAERCGSHLRQFRSAQIGPFATVVSDPPMGAIPVTGGASPWVVPPLPPGMLIPDESLRLTPPAGHLYGLRLRIEQPWYASYQDFLLLWRDETGQERSQFAFAPFLPAHGTLAIWINDSGTDFRLVRRGSGRGATITSAEWLVK